MREKKEFIPFFYNLILIIISREYGFILIPLGNIQKLIYIYKTI